VTRVYLATTRDGLAHLHATGALPAGAERVVAPGDDEESEYDALMTAAHASADLEGPGRRRVVVVAEVARPEDLVGLGDVVAVHCDPGDRAADADPDDDLAWFATQEIPGLLGD
jgi:hypothetical protein